MSEGARTPSTAPDAPVRRVTRFAGLYARLVREALGARKTGLVLVTGASIAGAWAQGCTIWLLSVLLEAMESDAEVTVPFVGVELGRDFTSLLIVVAALLALQLFSVLALHAAALQSRAIARRYHEVATVRILSGLWAAPFVRRDRLPEIASPVRQALVRSPRLMGQAIENILNSVRVVCLATAYAVVLFVLSTRISLFLLPTFLLLAPFLYRLGVRTQETSRSFYDQAASELSSYVRQDVAAAGQTNLHRDVNPSIATRRYLESDAIRHYHDSYDELRLAGNRSVLITSMFRALVLAAIVLVLGAFALTESYSWSVILPYVLALLQLMNSVQNLATSLASLHRFYPRIRQFVDVNEAFDLARRAAEGPAVAAGPFRIECVDGPLPGAELAPGSIAVLSTDVGLTRIDFEDVVRPVRSASGAPDAIWDRAAFVGASYAPPPVGLIEIVGGPPGAIVERLAALGLASEIEGLPGGFDAPLDDTTWEALSPLLRSAVTAMAVARADTELVFVDAALLQPVDSEHAETFRALLAEKIVFVVTVDKRNETPWADLYLHAEDGRLVGMGDLEWWRELVPRTGRLGAAVGGGGGDDEDLDDAL